MSTKDWYAEHQLVHYTRDAKTVASILEIGFLLVPNGRNLMQRLLNTRECAEREPQQFGMVSFTELRTAEATRHREAFGEFGIVVTWDWALRHSAQRVIYLGEGSVLESFSWLFQWARQELERQSPEPVNEFTLANRAVSGIYSQMYAHLLALYEFMEPERNSSQVEWRIVNPLPHYIDLSDRQAMIRRLIEQAAAWKKVGTVQVSPEDVIMLIAPPNQLRNLRGAIPAPFRSVPIVPLTGSRFASKLISLLGRLREPNPRPPMQSSPTLSTQGKGLDSVPAATKISGLIVNPDDVLERATVQIQYHSGDREFIDLHMPFIEAVRLEGFLRAALNERRLAPLLELALKAIHRAPAD